VSAAGATEGSQGQARSAPPLGISLGAVALVNYSIALSGLRLGLVDPGAARSALTPGYLLPRLRRCLSRSFFNAFSPISNQ